MSNELESDFEIIDQHGARHRFKRADGFDWAWRPAPGTMDVDDYKIIDVTKTYPPDDEWEIFASFPYPARVGNVDENVGLCMPFRELQMGRCPRCGFTKPCAPTPQEDKP